MIERTQEELIALEPAIPTGYALVYYSWNAHRSNYQHEGVWLDYIKNYRNIAAVQLRRDKRSVEELRVEYAVIREVSAEHAKRSKPQRYTSILRAFYRPLTATELMLQDEVK